jgi:mono/diheme cytochrome c family protein
MNSAIAIASLGVALAAGVAVAAGEPAVDQVAAGKGAYTARCAACHGQALEGVTHAPPLTGEGFKAKWQGQVARALYRRVLSTMPADTPGSLTQQEALDVVVYCLSVNGLSVAQPVQSPASLGELKLDFAHE